MSAERFVIAMYHPAAALHRLSLKSEIMADFARLPEMLNEARAKPGKPPQKKKTVRKK